MQIFRNIKSLNHLKFNDERTIKTQKWILQLDQRTIKNCVLLLMVDVVYIHVDVVYLLPKSVTHLTSMVKSFRRSFKMVCFYSHFSFDKKMKQHNWGTIYTIHYDAHTIRNKIHFWHLSKNLTFQTASQNFRRSKWKDYILPISIFIMLIDTLMEIFIVSHDYVLFHKWWLTLIWLFLNNFLSWYKMSDEPNNYLFK